MVWHFLLEMPGSSRRSHSHLSATTGSTREARRAGRKPATIATAASTKAADASANGSTSPMPNNMLRMKCVQPIASGAPSTRPAESKRSVSRRINRGVEPAFGRNFQTSDDVFRGPKVAILSCGLWERRFGGDQAIVGRRILLDGDTYTVIAVMPRGFENVLAPSTDIWTPLQYDPAHAADFDTGEWGYHLRMTGRLRPDVAIERAAHELNAIARNRVPEFPRPPWASLKNGFIVSSLQGEVTRGAGSRTRTADPTTYLGVIQLVLCVSGIACIVPAWRAAQIDPSSALRAE